jgi:hypothetical protein
MDVSADLVCLNTFFDALDARRACEFLEGDGIGFEVRNHSVRVQGVNRFHEGPGIVMEIFVNADDVQRAQSCLRRTMQLFPEPEIDLESSEAADDDDVLSEAFVCDTVADAQQAIEALHDAGIRGSFRKDLDSDDDQTYIVEVKGRYIEKAIEVINRWLSLKK